MLRKKYIVEYWLRLEDVFDSEEKAKERVRSLQSMESRKEIRIILLQELTPKK